MLIMAACEDVDLPRTELDAIEFVTSRLHPWPERQNLSPAACPLFLGSAVWSARGGGEPGSDFFGWVVTGEQVWYNSLGRVIASGYQIPFGVNSWRIESNGEVTPLQMWSPCSSK